MSKNSFKKFINYVKTQPEVMYERSEVAPCLEFVYITEGHFMVQLPYRMYEEFVVDNNVFLPLEIGASKIYHKQSKQVTEGQPRRIVNILGNLKAVLHAGVSLIDTGIEIHTFSGNVAVLKCNGHKCHIAVNSEVYHSIIDNFDGYCVYGSHPRAIINIANFDSANNVEFFLLPTLIDVDAKLNESFKYYEEVEF